MNSSIISIAKQYLQIPTAPFREHKIRDFIKSFCNEKNIHYTQDSYGNVIVHFKKTNVKATLAFVAHMDHPGFIAQTDSRNNRLSALFYGGWDPTEFEPAPIVFFNDSNEKISAEAIDWKKSSKDMAWKANLLANGKVKKGDIGMWDFSPFRIKKNLLFSRNCDDSIGCILILSLLEYFSTMQNEVSFYAIFTCAEESGLHGTKFICKEGSLNKNVVPISVETSRELTFAKIGDGVIIRVGDAQSIFHPDITSAIVDIAKILKLEDSSFLYQRKLMDGGRCEGSVFQSFGYRTGALSVPLGNYHNRNFKKKTTESEYVSLYDMNFAFLLMKAMIEKSSLFKDKKKAPEFREIKGDLGQRFFI